MNQSEKKKRFSAADALILAGIVLLLLAIGLFFFCRTARENGVKTTLRYRVLLSAVDGELFLREEILPIGATVRNENGTAVLGEVTNVSWEAHKEAVLSDGEVLIVALPHRYDVTLEVTADAIAVEELGLRVNDIRIAAGERYCMRFDGFVFGEALVIDVEAEEGI